MSGFETGQSNSDKVTHANKSLLRLQRINLSVPFVTFSNDQYVNCLALCL